MNIFKKIHSMEFIFTKECYKTCNSYCCKNPYFKYLSSAKSDNIVLPMLETEFLALDNQIQFKNTKNVIFALKNNKKIKIYFVECDFKGLCSPHNLRPLICKLYPYFPIVSNDGNFIRVRESTIYDLFYKDEKNHPCTLIRTNKINVINQLKITTEEIRKVPIMIFIFKSLQYIDEALQKYFKNIFGKKIFIDTLDRGGGYRVFQTL
ncbi:hypothetical protein [Campylobacter peloridis]|uniref:hypothetical protein n=1 Tax=Campylobacter peloridis TaxID=488546 RepID=UPI001C73AB89|nr:hypothetical protein [Campylobacter peloridis]MBX1886759.1 hypothetical protein [Campylobacter peloridis]